MAVLKKYRQKMMDKALEDGGKSRSSVFESKSDEAKKVEEDEKNEEEEEAKNEVRYDR